MESEQDDSKPPSDVFDGLTPNQLGKYNTPSQNEFFRSAQPIDMSKFLNPGSTIVPHYYYRSAVFVSVGGRGYVAAKNHLVLTASDIVLASFPKAGKTWLQEIIYNIWNKDEIDKPLTESIDIRFPHIEFPEFKFEDLISKPSPRLLNSHLPYDLLHSGNCDKKYKIIYIARNPKDIAVSSYFFYKMVQIHCIQSLKEFISLFLNDCLMFSPFGKHVLGYWNQRHQSNILFLKYEDLSKDMPMEIRKIAKFLNVDVDDELVNKIAVKCSFQQMSEQPLSYHSQLKTRPDAAREGLTFMRKGKVGDWKNYFDEETNKRFDEWIEYNFGNTDLTFDYEI